MKTCGVLNSQYTIQQKKFPSNGWTIKGLLRTACVGFLLLGTNVLAARDLCQQGNMRGFCQGNLGIFRRDMPQVEDGIRENYLFQKYSQGVRIQHVKIPPHSLTPIQSEINHSIVINMVKAKKTKGTFDPCERTILVAYNGTHHNIMDGHHTAMACRLLDGKQSAVVVEDKNNEVLAELQQLSGGFRRNLDDSVS